MKPSLAPTQPPAPDRDLAPAAAWEEASTEEACPPKRAPPRPEPGLVGRLLRVFGVGTASA